MTTLPDARDDEAIVEWLVERHGVAVIPGTAHGLPGTVRVCFANLDGDACEDAYERLRFACCKACSCSGSGGGGPGPRPRPLPGPPPRPGGIV